MPQFEIDGIVPIVPTPFLPDGSPDWDSLERLLDFAVSANVSAVCLPAYASEFYKLTDSERRDIAIRAAGLLGMRLPLIGQVNHVSTAYVAETARELERAGVSAISVAVPTASQALWVQIEPIAPPVLDAALLTRLRESLLAEMGAHA